MLSEPMYSARYLRLPSTGSNEMKHCRRKISLGRIESSVSFMPMSSKWRSIRSSHPAIQPPPDSRNAIFNFGKRSHTPHMMRLVAAAIISNVCATTWRTANPFGKRSIASVGCELSEPPWIPIETPSSCASVHSGSYSGSCSTRPLYGLGRMKPARKPNSFAAKRNSCTAISTDCIGSIAAPTFRVGYTLRIDSSRACADRAESAEPNFLLAAAEVEGVVAFDLEDFAASFGNDQFGTIVAKSRVTVIFPQIGWFKNVTVSVDDVIFHCVHLARFVWDFAGLSAFRYSGFRYGNYDIDMR